MRGAKVKTELPLVYWAGLFGAESDTTPTEAVVSSTDDKRCFSIT